MSSNLGSSSKRKREKRSMPEPEELRRSARQKGKNKLPVMQSAMNIKKAHNSLDSDSLNSIHNHSRANDQANVVQPTPAAIGEHINQSGSHNFNSDGGQTTMGHIHIVNEERASRLNPSAPEFHFDLSNNKPMRSYIQSSRSRQPIMTGTTESRQSIDQAAQLVQFVPHVASLNSQMTSYGPSRRVIQPVMPYTCNRINEALQPTSGASVDLNVPASSYHQISSHHDASRRLIPPQDSGFRPFSNQAARPVQFSPSFAALNSQMMSSDASQRADHLIMAESCNLSNEAPRPSSNTGINQNMQAISYHQTLSSQHGVPQYRRSSSYPIVDPTLNGIAVNQRYPSVCASSSQWNNYPVLDFSTREFNAGNRQRHMNFPRSDNFTTSYSQMKDSLSGDRSFALNNSLKGAGINISESDSSNNGRRSFSSILNSDYNAQTQLQLEAEFRRSMVMQDQPQSTTGPNDSTTTNSLDSLKRQNDARRAKHPRKETKCSILPVIMDHVRMEGGNPLSQSPPLLKPLGERCRLCKIDLAFKARGADPQSSDDLPFAAVLPCKHAFHDQCLMELFGDIEPPCVECLDALKPCC